MMQKILLDYDRPLEDIFLTFDEAADFVEETYPSVFRLHSSMLCVANETTHEAMKTSRGYCVRQWKNFICKVHANCKFKVCGCYRWFLVFIVDAFYLIYDQIYR
jgi:hypothetical protein